MINISVKLPNELHSKVKSRAKFYDITQHTLLNKLLANFAEGKYDEDLGIHPDPRYEKGKL